MRLTVATVAMILLLAGCSTSRDPTPTPTGPEVEPLWAQHAIFAGQAAGETAGIADHDHGNRTTHKGLSTPNFEVLGHDPMTSGYYGTAAGTSFCGDGPTKGSRRLAVSTSLNTDVALSVLDVTDPMGPSLVGELVLPYAFTYDAAISEDGRYAALAVNPDLKADMPAAPMPLPRWKTACGERAVPVHSSTTQDDTPYAYGTVLIDLADPANPVVADFFPDASRNVHSISMATIDGATYVATSALQAVPCTVPSVGGVPPPPVPVPCNPAIPRYGNLLSHFTFFTVQESSGPARLAPYSIYSSANPGNLDPELLAIHSGHVDATLQKHPLTGDLLGYLANWDGGFIIVRFDENGQASHLSTLYTADDAQYGVDMRGNVHSAVPLEVRDGRHYTLFGQEVVASLEGRPTGEVVLLDTTDPADPFPVARWTLPVAADWSTSLTFSTHYPVMDGDTLYVPLYHGGVWAADASPEHWPELPSLGVFLPDADAPEPFVSGETPEVLQVLGLGNHTLLVFDGETGAYTVRFDPQDTSVPRAAPWTKDAWIEARPMG